MSVEREVLAEIRALRARVAGISGALVASVDGLLIAQDVPGVEPSGAAAMAATTLGLGQRVAQSLIGPGEFREAVTRSGGGYFVAYAAGRNAVLAVLAPDGLNVGRLHFEARRTTARIADLVAARSTAR